MLNLLHDFKIYNLILKIFERNFLLKIGNFTDEVFCRDDSLHINIIHIVMKDFWLSGTIAFKKYVLCIIPSRPDPTERSSIVNYQIF